MTIASASLNPGVRPPSVLKITISSPSLLAADHGPQDDERHERQVSKR
jgi:hypothetical protein